MLTDAAVGHPAQRWLPGVAGAKAAAKLARRPRRVARRTAGLAVEVTKIAVGRSQAAPAKGDRRFVDPAWTGNPLFRRLGQAYLEMGSTVHDLLDDAELEWGDERRLRFAVDNVVAALAPNNFPLTNPTVIKALVDTGGGNLVRGTRQFVRDMARPPRIPTMVDRSSFQVGDNLALTPGAVVLRTPVFELIQYGSQTAKVREQPLLIVPPMINKYYITDLAPERSLVDHLVKSGQQVFAISWRNPDERAADWGLGTYAGAIIEALEATEAISRSPKSHVLGLCAGGIVLSTVVAHLAVRGEQERLAGMTLAVCVLDNHHAGTTAAFMDRRTAELAVAESARRGYLDGRALAGVFAWLRPTDLIWNYWVNNYLLGKDPRRPSTSSTGTRIRRTCPPRCTVTSWSSRWTNALVHAGCACTVLGQPGRPLGKITLPTPTSSAGISDHITPWQSGYRSTQLLGSAPPRFVLSNSGHIAAMVNPPGNEKASFRTHDGNPEDAAEWLQAASQDKGTWWNDWVKWLSQRSGQEKRSRKTLGSTAFKAMDAAPGTYVLNA